MHPPRHLHHEPMCCVLAAPCSRSVSIVLFGLSRNVWGALEIEHFGWLPKRRYKAGVCVLEAKEPRQTTPGI